MGDGSGGIYHESLYEKGFLSFLSGGTATDKREILAKNGESFEIIGTQTFFYD